MESTETLGSEQMGTDRDPGDQKHPTTSQQPRDSKMQLAKVLLPDGVQKEFEVNKNSEGEALFRQVTRDLSIEEREYFSLCFYDKDEGTRHWLYNDKNIAKQIKGLPWEFSFEVKFYPTTPTTIVDDHARYYVFLQLRRDLLTGRLPATADTHSLLGSFVAQIEFGDAPAEMTDAYEQFIVASKLVPSAQANPETYKKIVDLHREMRGQTPSEAENQFLDHCKHLALYGIHLFKAISDKDKKPVDVGIGAAGINIYQDEQKTHSFSWQNIIKIGYRRTYFSIKLKAGTVEKNEKTLYFKLPNHVAAKRTWKCAVEHHTFFRLIQPEDKTHKSFFNFGSQRFRYQGRTQFQTKIASQMFDKPSTVDRAPSAMSQPIATAENQKLQTLNLTDSELEQRQFERYRRALTPKSYTSSRQDDDAVSTATFAKYSRPSTLLVVSTSGHHQQSPHELSYSPRGDDSSNYSSAAYYMSERSSLRTPSSAYYPPSEYTSPTSPVYFEGQHHGEYHVQMRQTASTSATGPSNSGARRNLFGRASDARSSQASRDSVRLVSFHEPVDPNEPIPNTYPYSELPQIPIERIVHVYHEGHYDRLSPRRQQRPELPYGFGNYTPRNGVSHVDNLQPDGEMDQQPIRFYVDVRHSGASRRNLAKRLSHPGKEDIKEQIDPKDYYFSASLASDPIHRTELSREVQPANIQQYTRRYHHGDSIHKPDTPQYRLITHVHPLAVTNRDGRDGQSSSNLNATISQREQVVSTKVRRESPDADRRVRLSASVDRSGNLTDTTEEMTRSTNEAATPTTVVTTRIVEKKGKGKKNNQKIPPSSNKTDHASFEGQEKRSRFGGFFTKKTSQTLSGYPESTSQFTGELDATHRDDDLEPSTFSHSNKSQQYSSKQDKTIITSVESKSDSGNKKRLMAVESPEVPKKYRLIARIRHEGDEDVVEKPEKYSFVTDSHSGMLEETYRQKELDQIPISSHAAVYHHGKSWSIQRQSTLSQDRSKISSLGADDANLSKKKEVRLIARIESKTEEVAHKKHKKEGSSVFGFFNRPTKLPAGTEYPEKSNVFTGDLDTTGRTSDLEQHPFQHGTHPAYSPKNVEAYQPSENSNGESKTDIPAAYGFPSTSYDGPLETTSLERDLQHVTIAAHSNVYHHGDSSRIEKHASPVATLEKKQKKVKSPKKEKVDVPAEPEKKEIRLIARVRTEPEAEIVDVPVVKETKEKKGDSKSKLPTFGFFSKTTKTTKTTGYPETSEAYTGELDTTDRTHDLEGTSFEHGEHPAYSPKQTVIEAIETPAEPEKKRYRLIARFRHEGDEDVVEKPDPYQIATTLYDGPLDEISRETDLDHTPIADHANVYHHGDSSRIEKHASPVATLEKKQKKVKSPKKEKVDVPAEPEKKEIRLIARVRTEPEAEIVDVPVVKETKEKKGDSKSKLPTFGFFSKTTKTTKTTGYPETSEAYTGELDTTDRTHDLEGTSFEHGEHPAFEASSTSITIEAFDPSHEKVIKKPSRFHWFSRWRHEGDEDVVEKPEGYILSSEIYEGPYDNMRPIGELELTPILDHSQVYHNGESGKLEKRSSKEKRIKTPSPERVEPSEIKLVARIQPLEHVEDSEISEKLSPVKDRSRAPSFSMFHRQSKQRGYPEISPLYEGNLDVTGRAAEVENTPIEVRSVPEYHPKQEVSAQHPESSQPNRFYRLIARWRHEGDEDEIEKPDAYKFVTEVYEGPLDDIRPVVELAQDPISDHSQVYHNGESWKAEKNIKPPKPVRNTKKGLSPEPIESEVHEIRLLTRVASSSEEPEEVDVIPAESTPVKPFRLRFLSIGKKSPTSPDSEFPECSPQYDGPVDLTSRSDELEVMPYLHGSVPPYSPKFTPVKKVDKADEERKKYTVIYRFRHEGEEDFADKPEAYGFSSDVYTGSLNEISRSSELEHAAIHDHSQVYHDGLSYKIDNKQKKSKDRTELEEPKTSRLVARVLPQQEASDSGSPKKDDKDKGFRFRFFSKASPKSSGYPEVSPTFEGPIDVTGRVESLEHVPLQSREFPTYSPRKSQEKPSEKSSERTVEPKRYHLIARIRHEGDEETVENPDTYGFASTSYDGPLEETSKSVDVEETPISVYSNVYHHGESIRVEKRQRKAKISAEPEKDDDQENVPPKSRFSFLRGGQKRVLSYPSTLYSGPLETTDRDLDLENIPLSIPVHGSSDQHARKYRLIARIRHAGDEDEVAAHKLHPVFYSFPAVQYSGILEKTALCKEVDEVPIGRFARVYHSGSSGGLIWNLLKNRNSRASKDMDEPKRKRKDQKDQKDIKLIARVLPMKKTPEKSDRFEKATKEEPLREAELVRSTQSEAQGNISTVSYIPSSLTYDVPRPARIEGYTYGGDCYVEIRHERRAEVHLEPVYVLQETNARSHAYLSTATAVFSGASTSAAAADSGANSSTNTTSHSLVLPSFAASVSEDETGIHHFSWTPLHMSPQPEKMSFLARLGFKRDKSNKKDKKKRKKGENETSGETSDSEHDEKREFAIVEFEPESGQPYTTVSTWQETSDLPEQVEVYTDENGRQITRTVKSSQVKHTVQTQSFQNYIVDGDQVPVGVVDVERSREQLTPLGQKASSSTSSDVQNGGGENGGIVETQTRTMTYEAQGGENSAPPGWAEEGLGEYVSSKSVTQGNRTIETITYKTEKDGIVETHVEHRVTIHSDGDIDHDAELSQAILEATQMNPDMVVEKIEVRQETTQ